MTAAADAGAIVARARRERRATLYEPEAYALLEAFGMPFRQDNLPTQQSAAAWRQSRDGGDEAGDDHEQQQGTSTETEEA